MKRLPEIQNAVDYLNKHFPKGNKARGHAMVLLAIAQIGGRAEQLYLERNKEAKKLIKEEGDDL